ncbi:MAG: flagellar assembly protein FliH [Bacillales bacterium]|jgi:flagellar assembly protein FliH|nr:flagellar assembly protein FliH [Bacillales bacterium]
MKSYSKVFKASNLSILEEVKIICQPPPLNIITLNSSEEVGISIENENSSESLICYELIREQEANEKAQCIIDSAEESARLIELAAQDHVNKLRDAFHKESEIHRLEAKEQGFQEGFELGRQEAESQIQQEYSDKIEQANKLLELAHEQKDAIISEAEPFLLELSTAIATQIIKQELTDYPDKFVELIKQHILRIKEREYVSVCIHPDDYEFVQSQRAQLIAVVNGETEIKIIPDPLVSIKGCVIRTDYGSVDARIDTQIDEIKKVILDALRRGLESGVNS